MDFVDINHKAKAGRYDFSCLFHCLEDGDVPSRFRFQTESVTGTSDWKPVAARLVIPAETQTIRVAICRLPSEKFGNKIKGTLWVDDVSLRRE